MTDHDPATADEDRLVFPSAWRRHLPLRRGDGRTSKVAFDSASADRWRSDLSRGKDRIRERLSRPENRDYAAGIAFLDGEATPFGAAVVGVLIKVDHESQGGRLRPLFAGLLQDHGPAFAASTAVEYMDVHTPFRPEQHPGVDLLTGWADSGWFWQHVGPVLADIREFLAGLPAAEYAATTRAVAAHRGTRAKRFASAVLFPDEPGWLDQACREYGDLEAAQYDPDWIGDGVLLPVIRTPEQLEAAGWPALVDHFVTQSNIAALVHAAGKDSLPSLRQSVARNLGDRARPLFGAIAVLPSDEAMSFLLDCLDRPKEPSSIFESMQAAARFPQRAQRIAAAKAPGASGRERELLAMVARVAHASAPASDPETRAVIETLAGRGRSLPAAPTESLSRLLVAPPWAAKGAKPKPVVVDGLVPPPISRVEWTEDERNDHENRPEHRMYSDSGKEHYGKHGFDYAYFFAHAPMEDARAFLPQWNGETWYTFHQVLTRVLWRFGDVAMSPVMKIILADRTTYREALLPVVNLEAARDAAHCLARLKSRRRFGATWLDRHAADAAALLVPDALGRDKRARLNAEAALLHLAGAHGPALVHEAAAAHGAEAAAGIKALLENDPLEMTGVKIPKMPIWATPAQLPQVLLRGRKEALPSEAVEHLLTMLSFAPIDRPYPGIGIVAEHCDPESLARFSWALFELWTTLGAPPANGWALTQLAHFADDQVVRELAPLVGAWPGERQHKRAITGLEVLGAIGSDVALHALHRISETVKFKALKEKATEQIEAIAADLGLTTDQLGDRLVPDLGLDQNATLVLDYGARRFQVGFDEQLRPHLRDSDGKPRKSLPKPGADDDPVLASAARARFTTLKKELRTITKALVTRLERAMIDGRTWTIAEFDEYLVRHPLVRHLTGRLVWLAETDGSTTAFRIAEDRTRTDVDEEELNLPDDAVIRLAHPVHLGDQVEAWTEIFADYEILQPFEQLGRTVMAFTPEELRTGRIRRFEGVEIATVRVFGLTHKGWHRTDRRHDEPGVFYPYPGGGFLLFELEHGISFREPGDRQAVKSVRLSHDPSFETDGDGHPTDIDPVAASESLASLARLAEAG